MKKDNKKAIAFFALAIVASLAFTLFGVVGRASAETAYTGSAECMIVLERDSGRVLNEKNADKKRPMASTTKIATAITVIENVADLDKKVKVPSCAVGVEGSSIYLENDEELTVRDLLYGLMLQSGNDCAVALAVTTAGSVEKFAELMNETARKAGATNTHFVNPHGLHNDEHYTTARDLGMIAAYAMKNAVFREIVGTKRYVMPWKDREYDRVIVNKNKILSTYDGGDGVKTGYTKKAGRCLVASATRNGMNVIAVVLNCGPMFEDCRQLLENAFSTYSLKDVSEAVDLSSVCARVDNGKTDSARLETEKGLLYPLTEDEYRNIRYEVSEISPMRAPVHSGDENGKIKIYSDNRLLFERKLYSIEEVASLDLADILYDIVGRWD